jgi:hypothetical protein
MHCKKMRKYGNRNSLEAAYVFTALASKAEDFIM